MINAKTGQDVDPDEIKDALADALESVEKLGLVHTFYERRKVEAGGDVKSAIFVEYTEHLDD